MSNHGPRETALELASNLIPIRPLRPGLKRPWPGLDGKALTLGHPDLVAAFYEKHPEANVGACLAPIDHSPIAVVDIDICDVAPEERQKVWTLLGSLGVSTKDTVWVQRTGRDNWQVFYWVLDMELPLRHIDAGGMHIDLLANGYVVIAQSNTKDEPPKTPGVKGGGPYRWVPSKSPWDYSLSSVSEPPKALIAWWREQVVALPDPSTSAIQASYTDDGKTPITTKRNVTLTSIAGVLAMQYGPAEMAQQLRVINQQRCIPPLPASEVETIIRSINGRENGQSGYSPKDTGHELQLF